MAWTRWAAITSRPTGGTGSPLARLVNDLESLPNSDSRGREFSGLSPRLEAELIAMLSRPQTMQASPADRAQAAAVFGMMGLFAGVVLVAALAWLYSMTQQMNEQSQTLAKLDKTLNRTDSVQKAALDALLSKTEAGRDTNKFVENYEKTRRELDEARDLVTAREKTTTLALADNKRLEAEIEKLLKEKAAADKSSRVDLDRYETEKQKVNELSDELAAVYKTTQGELSKKYSYSLYAAIAGWIVAVLASLGLLGLWLAKNPLEDEPGPRIGSTTIPVPGVSPTSNSPQPQEPPHQIL